ncbi:ParA family protein [Haloarchaeobius sp. HME9146]|uniref:ParA family protein n=1 Tax=Haloarchaeobius sp. HME9146 TaxID=2978732 RepID=UPI0021C1421F|nr:ParA family protein [Haloarchaeobius sp. HME9146]MCT9094679.1 ParA family protein [Haloarchaeobius sp. HME9146]
MTNQERSAAIVGATGGAGATRLTVELAATLARDGRSVAVFDASFATQGLSHYVHGRIDIDVTRLLTDDSVHQRAAMIDLGLDTPAPVVVCPAYASLERFARAKSGEAADRFGEIIRRATESYDHVLVDTPPVADNPSIAAVNAADRVAVVVPPSKRGVDTLRRTEDRLTDIGAGADRVLANRVADLDEHPVESADVAIPRSEVTGVAGSPVCVTGETGPFAQTVATAAEAVFNTQLGIEFPRGGLRERLASRF